MARPAAAVAAAAAAEVSCMGQCSAGISAATSFPRVRVLTQRASIVCRPLIPCARSSRSCWPLAFATGWLLAGSHWLALRSLLSALTLLLLLSFALFSLLYEHIRQRCRHRHHYHQSHPLINATILHWHTHKYILPIRQYISSFKYYTYIYNISLVT